ncbi:MAG: ABC transporter permease [Armatimonadetes bacterium]|nr:ABC transporter permease [Armatimonadota bacterium]
MARFVLERLSGAILTLVMVSIAVVVLLAIAPGDPVLLMLMGRDATPDAIARLRHELGLDRPLHVQYLSFVGGLLRGDLGQSWQNGDPVTLELARVYPATLRLSLWALGLSTLVGVGLGIIAALRPYTLTDTVARATVLLGVSVPIFWLALMLILVFSVRLHWLPSSGRGTWQHLVLPATALATYSVAIIARMTRASFLEVLHQDYVRTARAKGLAGRTVVLRHALQNALIPIVTVLGLQLGYLLGGAVVTETVFAYPGLGWLMLNAIASRDYPVVRAVVLAMAAIFVLVNAGVDLLYAYLDPRIRYA